MQDPTILTAMSSPATCRTLRDEACTCACWSRHRQHLGFTYRLNFRNAQLRVRLFLILVTFGILGFINVLDPFYASYPSRSIVVPRPLGVHRKFKQAFTVDCFDDIFLLMPLLAPAAS